MDSNTYSTDRGDRLGSLVAANQELAAQDLDGLSEVALAEDTVRLNDS
jgi:hypothetical protein